MNTMVFADQFMIFLGVTILFTVLALSLKQIPLHLLAMFCWYFLAFISTTINSDWMRIFSYLCLLFGFVFTLATINSILSLLEEKKKSREWLGELPSW